MNDTDSLALDRFRDTLEVVHREGRHLLFSASRICSSAIDAQQIVDLEGNPMLAVEIDAFVSRFGRMQDTIAGKLLPRWLIALAETPGSQIEVLNRAERLGVLEDTSRWLAVRQLRNLLVHEYLTEPGQFAEHLDQACASVPMLIDTYNRVRSYMVEKLADDPKRLPGPLPAP